MSKKVVFVLYDGLQLLDVSGPAGVLTLANRFSDNFYELHYVSANSNGKIVASNQMNICTSPLPEELDMDVLLIPGGELSYIDHAAENIELMSWMKSALESSNTNVSVCTGAFFLAKLGILKNKRVATHWAGESILKERYPDLNIISDSLYQNDGNLWSSGGVMSGVDMMLAMVSKDLGADISLQVAKLMVVHLVREGGQSQYSLPLEFQSRAKNKEMRALVSWLQSKLDQTILVKDMAEYNNMSVRRLHNYCQESFGLAPAQLLTEIRLEHARNLLRDASVPMIEIASICGYSQSSVLSHAFKRRFGISPTRYREYFQSEVN